MNSVWQASERLKARLETVPGWMALALAAAFIAIAAGIVWQLQANVQDSQVGDLLLDGRRFTDSQLGPIVQAFSKAKLSNFVVDDRRIRVPRGKAHSYLTALASANALPRDLQSHTAVALEQNKFFESGRDRQFRIQHAREQDLAAAIRAMVGIDDAMVQFDETEQRGFNRQRLVTASVAILPAENHVLDRGQIRTIRHLVAFANAGILPEDINIADLRSGLTYTKGSEENALLPRAEEYLSVKRAIENDWRQKVGQVLSFVPNIQVAVDVELAAEQADITASTSLTDPKRIAILVAVPDNYLLQIWRNRTGKLYARPIDDDFQTLEEQTELEIRNALLSLIPNHIDMASAVTVTTFRDVPHTQSTFPSFTIRVYDLLQKHQAASIIVVVVGAIVGLASRRRRRSIRKRLPVTIPMTSHTPGLAAAEKLNDDTVDGQLDEQALRATLTDMVRDDPDGAAEILHRWIDKAG